MLRLQSQTARIQRRTWSSNWDSDRLLLAEQLTCGRTTRLRWRRGTAVVARTATAPTPLREIALTLEQRRETALAGAREGAAASMLAEVLP